MNNSSFDQYAIQQPKKNSNLITIIVGAVLAATFLLCTLCAFIVIILDIDYIIYLFKDFMHGPRLRALYSMVMEPIAYLLFVLSPFAFFVYSALTAILKGKKIKFILAIAFLLEIFANSIYLLQHIVDLSSLTFLYQNAAIILLFLYIFYCLTAIIGFILCFINNNKVSMIVGISGAFSTFITLILATVNRISSFVVLGITPTNLFYLFNTVIYLLAIMVVFLLLRPAKD